MPTVILRRAEPKPCIRRALGIDLPLDVYERLIEDAYEVIANGLVNQMTNDYKEPRLVRKKSGMRKTDGVK